jgi:hypothetical protein
VGVSSISGAGKVSVGGGPWSRKAISAGGVGVESGAFQYPPVEHASTRDARVRPMTAERSSASRLAVDDIIL